MKSKQHRQWSDVKMVFHANQSYPTGAARRNSSTLSIESPDITQCTIQKEIGQAAGGFFATLVPRQEYLSNINPNDWVEVFLDNGDGFKLPVMIASIDRIARRRSVSSSGASQESISLTGRDYGKVFLSIMIIIDPLIGSIVEQTTFEPTVIVARFSDNDVPFNSPDEVITALLKKYHDGRVQCLLPSSLTSVIGDRGEQVSRADLQATGDVPVIRPGGLVSRLGPTRGQQVLGFNPNLSGNLWTTMEQYSHPMLNAFWVDTVDGIPTIYLMERPYSHDAFGELPAVAVSETEVTQEEFGKSDFDTKNWIRVYPDAQYLGHEVVDAVGTGYGSAFSMARAGLRKLEATTTAFGDFKHPLVNAEAGLPTPLLQEWAGMLAEWYTNNELLVTGSMTTRLRPDARVGQRLDYTNERTGELLSFYIEGITHSFQYPQGGTTSFALTRGVERKKGSALRFPLLRRLDQLETNEETQALNKLKYDVVVGDLDGGQLA